LETIPLLGGVAQSAGVVWDKITISGEYLSITIPLFGGVAQSAGVV